MQKMETTGIQRSDQMMGRCEKSLTENKASKGGEIMSVNEAWMKGAAQQDVVRREAFDVIPRTLFTSGIVFLALVVPLYFSDDKFWCLEKSCCVNWCFRISALLMALSLGGSGFMLKRAFRVACTAMKIYDQTLLLRELQNGDAKFLTKWEKRVFIAAIVLRLR